MDDLTTLRQAAAKALRARQMAEWRSLCRPLADAYEEGGLTALAARRRLKADTLRSPGVLWPHAGLVPNLTPHQTEQLRRATCRPVGLLTGSPGTGKTHVLAQLVRALVSWCSSGEAHGGNPARHVAVCAPTGKAAVRCSELLQRTDAPLAARTIHQLLEVGRNGHDGEGWGFRRGEARPLDQRFVIVDEVSMLDTSLLASLLRALTPGAHLLLVGDPGQLPPVGHGAPLRDMIAAGLPCGELTEIRRNAGGIVEACRDVRQGRPFGAAPPPWNVTPEQNLLIVERRDPLSQLAALDDVLNALAGTDLLQDVQVICALNDGVLGRQTVNLRLQELLNPAGARVDGNPYRVGDKVICLRNGAYPTGGGLDGPEEGQAWLANGEMGRVAHVEKMRCWIEIPTSPRPFRVPLSDPWRDCFALGWAVTGHKAQGSEWPVVIVLVDSSRGADRVCGREWIYTAISRARRECYLIGRLAVAHGMARRPMIERRKTFLRELLVK